MKIREIINSSQAPSSLQDLWLAEAVLNILVAVDGKL